MDVRAAAYRARRLLAACAAVLAGGLAPVAFAPLAFAQGPQVPDSVASTPVVVAYPNPQFDVSKLQNALEIVERLPGFTFQRGGEADPNASEGQRRSNVLINGQPPVGTEPIDVILRRIPVSAVDRVELVRSGAGYDMMGYSLVANVVRRAPAADRPAASAPARPGASARSVPPSQSNLTSAITVLPDGDAGGSLTAETRRRKGERIVDGSLIVSRLPSQGAAGRRVRTSQFTGTVTTADLDSITYNLRGEARGALDTPLGKGRLRLNAAALYTDAETFSSETFTDRRTQRRSFNDRQRLEGTLRYSRQITGGHQLDSRLFQQMTRTTNESGPLGADPTFTSERLSGSTAASMSFAYGRWKALKLEVGGQGEHTWQEAVSSFSGTEEAHRDTAELNLTGDWEARDDLNVDFGLFGQLVQLGTNRGGDETYAFLRPRLAAVWEITAQDQLSFTVERTVIPVNLDNLAVNSRRRADLEDDEEEEIVQGALRLAPETVTSARLRLQRRVGRMLVFMEFNHQERQNIVDLGPFPRGGDAYANIGDGRRQTLVANIDAPLDSLGVTGGTLRLRMTARVSDLIDPFTGEERRQSGERPLEFELGFRQELKALESRWGVEASGYSSTTSWRRTEVSTTRIAPTVMLYVEHQPDPKLTLRAEVRNLTDREQRIFRETYLTSRATGRKSSIEQRETRTGPVFYVSARHTF